MTIEARPLISVVIATRNRARLLETTIDAVANQEEPHGGFELVIADNGSSDDTAAVVHRAAAACGRCVIRYVHVPVPGKSRAVNAALRLVRGDIVAFTDDDVRPDASWLKEIARALEDSRVAFVAGRVLPEWETAPPAWLSPALYGVLAIPDGGTVPLRIEQGLNDHVMPIGANMAIRAELLRRIGGLREDLGKLEGTLQTGEDHELFLRLLRQGYRGAYEPRAAVRHWVPRQRLNRAYFRNWLYQNGRDVARLQRSYPTAGRRLFRVPLYRWREAVAATIEMMQAALRRDGRRRFSSSLKVIWLAGYMWERWRGDRTAVAPPPVGADTRERVAGAA
jgi:glucosyl-dolichyl phosphate glucuronosyltransferase